MVKILSLELQRKIGFFFAVSLLIRIFVPNNLKRAEVNTAKMTSEQTRNDQLSLLSWMSAEKVATARIMVVGCGALGNEVLKNLALIGVGHLTLVDFDRVEPRNLSRSILFTEQDAVLQRPKVEAAAERIRDISPKTEVETINGDIAYDVGLGLVRDMDVVIGCVDNRWARYCINRLCMRANKPWVDGGIDGLEGTARVFRPEENCYACNLGSEALKDLAWRMPCAGIIRRNQEAGRAATTPITASIIAAVQVQEALKLIHREQLEAGELTSLCGKMFCYEGQHLTTKTVSFQAYDDDCPVHERWEPVIASDMTTMMTVGESLKRLKMLLKSDEVSFTLENAFVDFVEHKATGRQTNVMLPARAVAEYIELHTALRGCLTGDLLQHEYHEIDDTFPYQQLTLKELGIPESEILYTNHGFVEVNN